MVVTRQDLRSGNSCGSWETLWVSQRGFDQPAVAKRAYAQSNETWLTVAQTGQQTQGGKFPNFPPLEAYKQTPTGEGDTEEHPIMSAKAERESCALGAL